MICWATKPIITPSSSDPSHATIDRGRCDGASNIPSFSWNVMEGVTHLAPLLLLLGRRSDGQLGRLERLLDRDGCFHKQNTYRLLSLLLDREWLIGAFDRGADLKDSRVVLCGHMVVPLLTLSSVPLKPFSISPMPCLSPLSIALAVFSISPRPSYNHATSFMIHLVMGGVVH